MTNPLARLDSIETAIAAIKDGRPVVVIDDEDRENEGDLIFAASKSTPELMAFTIRHSSGVICVPMPGAMLDRLEIPLMTPHNKDKMRTAYTISVDARDGVSTGISAADRAHTARVLADSATEPWELTRPGHVFPLRYREGGVLVRRGHTEAAVDLARMAGLVEPEGLGRGVGQHPAGARAVGGRDAGRDAVPRVDRHGVGRAHLLAVVGRHERDRQAVEDLARDGGAHQAAGVAHQERHELGRRLARGEDDVALVLARLVVDDDHGLAGRDVGDRPLDGVEAHGGLVGHDCSLLGSCGECCA